MTEAAEQQLCRSNRIALIDLDQGMVHYRSSEIENERAIAVQDLLSENQFAPKDMGEGPYHMRLSVADNRLCMTLSTLADDSKGEELGHITVPITPFRRIIKDYFMVCESYYDTIRKGSVEHIEAIDMGRRAIHNEGSEILQQVLAEKADFDFETARRLFTLICVLHIK